MGVEYERKFRATPEIQSAIDRDFPGDRHLYRMETTYYDTPSESLSARKFTLRRRMENDLSVCALKAPAGDWARGEWEVKAQSIEAAIPMLCKLGAPAELAVLTQEGLVALCGARFYRTAITLCQEDCTLELALDRGVLLGGGTEIPLCEVEVELKSGNAEGVDRFAQALVSAYDLHPEHHSKFRRALALCKGETL